MKTELFEFLESIKDSTIHNTMELVLKTQLDSIMQLEKIEIYDPERYYREKENNPTGFSTPQNQERELMFFKKISPLMNESQKIQCKHCPSKLSSRKTYLEHMKNFHDEEPDYSVTDPLGNLSNMIITLKFEVLFTSYL